MENYAPKEKRPPSNKVTNFIRKRAAPFIVAGASLVSGGSALAGNLENTEKIDNPQKIETTYEEINWKEVFSPENVAMMNKTVQLFETIIKDFQYTTEKQEKELSNKIDASISQIERCVNAINTIQDKKFTKTCSSYADTIISLLREYRASQFTNSLKLGEALLVQDIMRHYVETYNERYQHYLNTIGN